MTSTETALLTAARAWFDVWAASEGRLSASQAACLPEFHPLLTAMVEDSDARTENAEPLCTVCGGELLQFEDGPDDTLECAWCDGEDAGQVSSCDPAVYPERTDA